MWCGQLNNVFVTGGYVRVLHGVVLTMLWHIVWYATVLGPAIQTMKRSIQQLFYFVYFHHHFYFPAQLVDFTLSDLLDKPWSQASSLLPPGTFLLFLSRIGFSIPTTRRFSLNVANSRSRASR